MLRASFFRYLTAGCVVLGLASLGCSESASPDRATLNILNWSDYINEELLQEFEEKTGARVQYDKYSSDSELEAKLATTSGYDVVFPSDRSMTPLLRKDRLAELDRSLLPHFQSLDPKFLRPRFDPENRYSVPYFWGTLAVGYRSDRIPEPGKGLDMLFDERYRHKIVMPAEGETAVAATMLYLGLPMNSTEDAHLAMAKEALVRQRPLVQAYLSDSDTVKRKLITGHAWVVLGWSGDLMQAQEKEENIAVIVPDAGTMIWVDSMAIPRTAKNPALAHQFIDFMLDPEVAARNANFVKYASPNAAARASIDPKLLDNEAIYPSEDVLSRCQWLEDRGPAIAKIERLWRQVRK